MSNDDEALDEERSNEDEEDCDDTDDETANLPSVERAFPTSTEPLPHSKLHTSTSRISTIRLLHIFAIPCA